MIAKANNVFHLGRSFVFSAAVIVGLRRQHLWEGGLKKTGSTNYFPLLLLPASITPFHFLFWLFQFPLLYRQPSRSRNDVMCAT
jgi:hypothetical protein